MIRLHILLGSLLVILHYSCQQQACQLPSTTKISELNFMTHAFGGMRQPKAVGMDHNCSFLLPSKGKGKPLLSLPFTFSAAIWTLWEVTRGHRSNAMRNTWHVGTQPALRDIQFHCYPCCIAGKNEAGPVFPAEKTDRDQNESLLLSNFLYSIP